MVEHSAVDDFGRSVDAKDEKNPAATEWLAVQVCPHGINSY